MFGREARWYETVNEERQLASVSVCSMQYHTYVCMHTHMHTSNIDFDTYRFAHIGAHKALVGSTFAFAPVTTTHIHPTPNRCPIHAKSIPKTLQNKTLPERWFKSHRCRTTDAYRIIQVAMKVTQYHSVSFSIIQYHSISFSIIQSIDVHCVTNCVTFLALKSFTDFTALWRPGAEMRLATA